jgi:MoaA/NifB/PqqE/SkfB family radical SAM enzyme
MIPIPTEKVTQLNLILTHNCNSMCKSCTYWKEKCENIPFNYLEKIITNLKPLGLCSVMITGGEPTLSPIFNKTIKLFYDNEILVKCATNGTLMSKIEECTFDRVNHWSISLDSMKDATYQKVRGINKRKKVLEFVQFLKEISAAFSISYLIHTENITELPNFLVYIKQKGFKATLLLPQLNNKYGVISEQYDYEIIPKSSESEYLRVVEWLRSNYKQYISISNLSLDIINNLELLVTGKSYNSGMHGVCAVPLNEITLGFDGEKLYQKMCFFDNMDLNINFNNIANDMRIQLSRGEYYIGNKRKNQCNNCVQYFKQ